jgi:hypothetical protein
MLHREFPASVTQQTICAYFWAGVAVGVLPYQSSKAWAFSAIEVLESPPIEIIEVATASDRNSALDALQASAHGADQQTAGRLLLEDLHSQLKAGAISPMEATRAAMRVAQTTGLPDQVYYDFDGLDDELQLAVNGTYGPPAEIEADILKSLAEHAGAT